MKCRYCNDTLAPLRSLTDGEFCSDGHRKAFLQEQRSLATAIPGRDAAIQYKLANDPQVSNPAPTGFHQNFADEPPPTLRSPQPPPYNQVSSAVSENPLIGLAENVGSPRPKPFIDEPSESAPIAPDNPSVVNAGSEPAFATSFETPLGTGESTEASMAARKASAERAASLRWLTSVWKNAPRDLKAITLLLPVLLAVAVGPSMPRVRIPRTTGDSPRQIFAEHWKALTQTISSRAAVAFTDDFRSGLDAWQSRSNLTTSWSYDAAGFVQPGPLAIFKPTTDMTDYRFEFLGEIARKSMGCAFRASNLNNYYALKFTEVTSGPLPLVRLVRYSVINGKEGPHVEKPLPLTVRADMLYRVMVDVRGSDFTIMAQGQVVDFWSDSRLPKGGVGFFEGRGEKARLRWVEVSHQYDALGRLCAYLAPYGLDGVTKPWN